MPFHIVRNDIAAIRVDAVVNTANPMPVIGAGVDSAIHQAAGPQLLAARKKIGQLRPGDCAVTPGFDLPAKYVIHTVGPVWRGGLMGEGRILRKCYEDALKLAAKHGCESIALPLISAGTYGFPRERAMQIALNCITAFLTANELTAYLVVYDKESYRLSERLFADVESYIDDNYISARPPAQNRTVRRMRAMSDSASAMGRVPPEACCAPLIMAPSAGLDQLLEQTDAGFSETLLRLIDEGGHKDPYIYKRANVSRQHFSKIRNDPHYKPTKATAIAFAIALELDLEQTQDLIGRAGFTLTRASKFDVIILYFIEHKNYNIMDINMTLFEFDQPALGA